MSQRRHSDYINVDMLNLNDSDDETEADSATLSGVKVRPLCEIALAPSPKEVAEQL